VLGQQKIALIDQYAKNFTTLTDETADKIATESLKNALAYEKLHAKYYDKSKKAIGALNAAKFIQAEVYLQTTIRSAVQDAIPFIGDIDRTKKVK
jgi:hypothetical protein